MPTPNRSIPYVPEGTLDPAAGLNIALDEIDAKFLPAIISMALSSPPGSPSDGDMYIPQSGSTGAWSGLGNRLVRYRSEGAFWQSYEPDTVWLVFNQANEQIYFWNGDSSGAWEVYGGTAGAADDITYDNSASGLAAANVQDAIDELAASITGDSNGGGGGSSPLCIRVSVSADQDNWNPTGWSQGGGGVTTIFVASTSTVVISGLDATNAVDGQEVNIVRDDASSNAFSLSPNNASSSASNRFRTPSDNSYSVGFNQGVRLVRDGIDGFWRVAGK